MSRGARDVDRFGGDGGDRMTTSKLYVDPAHVAEAEDDEWAK